MCALRLICALLFVCMRARAAPADSIYEIDGREEFAELIKHSDHVWVVLWMCGTCLRVGDPAYPGLKDRSDAIASTWAALPAHVNVSVGFATLDMDDFQLQAISQQKPFLVDLPDIPTIMVLHASKVPQMRIGFAGGLMDTSAEALGADIGSLLAGYATDETGKIKRRRTQEL